MSVNECAHQLGRASPEHGYGEPGDAAAREKAAYAFDQDVMPPSVVELVGTLDAVYAANEMRSRLERFRDVVTKGDDPPAYRSDEYDEVYKPFRKARDRCIAIARQDLRSG